MGLSTVRILPWDARAGWFCAMYISYLMQMPHSRRMHSIRFHSWRKIRLVQEGSRALLFNIDVPSQKRFWGTSTRPLFAHSCDVQIQQIMNRTVHVVTSSMFPHAFSALHKVSLSIPLIRLDKLSALTVSPAASAGAAYVRLRL